jgi:hypothetical protein
LQKTLPYYPAQISQRAKSIRPLLAEIKFFACSEEFSAEYIQFFETFSFFDADIIDSIDAQTFDTLNSINTEILSNTFINARH